MECKYQAIVLSKIDIAETDRIYTAYTREAGKLRLVARGVRKPNAKLAGSLEPVTHAEIFLARSRGNGKITGAIGADCFLFLKENILALEKVFSVFKVFDRMMAEEEQDERTFELLLGYLATMDRISGEVASLEKDKDENFLIKTDILTLGFLFKLFFLLGYGLEVKRCVECFGPLVPGSNFFSAERGGTLCQDCARRVSRKLNISDSAIKMIRVFLENRIENLTKLKADKKNLDNLKIILNDTVRWLD